MKFGACTNENHHLYFNGCFPDEPELSSILTRSLPPSVPEAPLAENYQECFTG